MILNRKQVEKEITNYSFREDFVKYNLKIDENLDIEDLKKTIQQASKFSKFETEMSRREFIVSPILFKLSYLIDIQVHSEENIYYSDNLRGKLDYLIEAKTQFIIIEAKNNDLEIGGFKQLTMELIALDKIIENNNQFLYGAVTLGTEWGFLILDRKNKIVIRDLTKYIVPDRLNEIITILLNMLENHTIYTSIV